MATTILKVTIDDLIEMSIEEINEMVDEAYGELTTNITYTPLMVDGMVIHILATFDPAE